MKNLKNIVKYPKFGIFFQILKFLKFLKKKFQNFEWITRLVQSASLAGQSGLLGTRALLLLARFPRLLPMGTFIKTFRHLQLWPQKPFQTSGPTFEDFERLERGGMGQRGESLWWRVEFSGSLRHLLGTS